MSEKKRVVKNGVKRRIGRPTKKTKELIDKILERVMSGETIYEICKDKDMPHESSIYNWLSQDSEFFENLARARELGTYPQLERLKNRLEAASPETAKADENYYKFMMWLTGKYNKQFSDQKSIELTGDKDKPVEVRHSIPQSQLDQLATIWSEIDDEEAES